jgi:hypothetical protein
VEYRPFSNICRQAESRYFDLVIVTTLAVQASTQVQMIKETCYCDVAECIALIVVGRFVQLLRFFLLVSDCECCHTLHTIARGNVWVGIIPSCNGDDEVDDLKICQLWRER